MGGLWSTVNLIKKQFCNFTTPVFSHVWAIAGSASRVFQSALFRSYSPARSSSLCSFTGDKTTMLSISRPSRGVQEDKNPGSQAQANNTACSISLRWTHRSVHLPLVRDSARSIAQLLCHVPHACFHDARGLLSGVCVCCATSQGGTHSLGKFTSPPPQVSIKAKNFCRCYYNWKTIHLFLVQWNFVMYWNDNISQVWCCIALLHALFACQSLLT